MLNLTQILGAISCLITLTSCIQIKTKLGAIKGTERKSRDGKTYYAFSGVPYAQPPLGKLRFKNPVRVKSWKEMRDATKEAPTCLQNRNFEPFMRNGTVGQEDCLYLSVYTPDLKPKEKLAVMVRTHGGGWRRGNAGPRDNPDYLMDGNVVLVSVHYRLGILGFLSTEDSVISGNFGLKDQSMALHWVKENIHSFGGNGERITVFGESAGGGSANYHIISPLSRNLIRGAISQSGVLNEIWALSRKGKARSLAGKVAEIVGCGGKINDELVTCLQDVPPDELTKVELVFMVWKWIPYLIFQPVLEPPDEGAFIPFDPLKQETTLPWMTGIVRDEGVFIAASLLSQDESITQQFIDNINECVSYILHLETEGQSPEVKATIELIKGRYFPPPLTIQSTIIGLQLLLADAYFTVPMAVALSKHRGPAYQYLFSYRGGSSYSDLFGELGELGISHMDELLYLFNFTEIWPKTKPNDEKVSRTLVKLWTNFAKYQKPTTEDDQIDWPEYDSMGFYLNITEEPRPARHLGADIIDWWMNLPMYKAKPQKTFDKSEL